MGCDEEMSSEYLDRGSCDEENLLEFIQFFDIILIKYIWYKNL